MDDPLCDLCLQEIMMDHTLRTVSYIADIGDILVIMARRRLLSSPGEENLRKRKQAKILCHVFETDEVRLLFQAISAFLLLCFLVHCKCVHVVS